MIIYIILFILITLLAICNRRFNLKLRHRISILIFMIFLVIAGFRDKVGSDWNSYYNNYVTIKIWVENLDSYASILYYYATLAFSLCHFDFHLYILFIFVLSFSFKYKIVDAYSENIYLSLLIYISGIFLIFDLNGLRQGLALSLCLLSYKYIIRRQLSFFLICVLIASLIHISALVFLPFYFLSNFKFSLRKYIYLTILMTVSGYYLSTIFSSFSFMDGIAEVSAHLDYYNNSDIYIKKVSLFDVATLRRFFIWSFILFFSKDDNSKISVLAKNSYLYSFFFFFFFHSSMEVAYRISYFYIMGEMIIIPNIITSINRKKLRYAISLLFVLYYFFMMYKLISNPNGELINYHNILF